MEQVPGLVYRTPTLRSTSGGVGQGWGLVRESGSGRSRCWGRSSSDTKSIKDQIKFREYIKSNQIIAKSYYSRYNLEKKKQKRKGHR